MGLENRQCDGCGAYLETLRCKYCGRSYHAIQPETISAIPEDYNWAYNNVSGVIMDMYPHDTGNMSGFVTLRPDSTTANRRW